MKPVILGTRGSRLALAQAETCAAKLRRAGLPVEIRTIRTTSEQLPETPLAVIDHRDVFTRQLDEALLAAEVDLAVHSLKDVPTDLSGGLDIIAVSERYDPSDVLVSEDAWELHELPFRAVVATSSLRRQAQLLHRRPDLQIAEIRGNLDTRIRKMREGYADALVLAHAGLKRLELQVSYTVIPFPVMLPAVGQGALAVTALRDHPLRDSFRAALNHTVSEKAVYAERALLRSLEGGCRVPVGALATVEGREISLKGVVAAPDGSALYRGEATGKNPEEVGVQLAQELRLQGAEKILEGIREVRP